MRRLCTSRWSNFLEIILQELSSSIDAFFFFLNHAPRKNKRNAPSGPMIYRGQLSSALPNNGTVSPYFKNLSTVLPESRHLLNQENRFIFQNSGD